MNIHFVDNVSINNEVNAETCETMETDHFSDVMKIMDVNIYIFSDTVEISCTRHVFEYMKKYIHSISGYCNANISSSHSYTIHYNEGDQSKLDEIIAKVMNALNVMSMSLKISREPGFPMDKSLGLIAGPCVPLTNIHSHICASVPVINKGILHEYSVIFTQ